MKRVVLRTFVVLTTVTGLQLVSPVPGALGVGEELDPFVCPILATLSPGFPGVVDINSQGDVFVGGEPLWDCPPYDIVDPDAGTRAPVPVTVSSGADEHVVVQPVLGAECDNGERIDDEVVVTCIPSIPGVCTEMEVTVSAGGRSGSVKGTSQCEGLAASVTVEAPGAGYDRERGVGTTPFTCTIKEQLSARPWKVTCTAWLLI